MAQINKSNRRRTRGPDKSAYCRGKELYFRRRYKESYDTLKQSFVIKITASCSYFISLSLLDVHTVEVSYGEECMIISQPYKIYNIS